VLLWSGVALPRAPDALVLLRPSPSPSPSPSTSTSTSPLTLTLTLTLTRCYYDGVEGDMPWQVRVRVR